MRYLTILLFLAWTSSASAINPWVDTRYPRKDVTVDFLYETCSVVGETARGKIPYFDCESYVYGVLDAYLAARASIPKAQRACFAPALPAWQALRDALPLVDTHRSEIAAPFLLDALRRKYPCP